VPFAVMASNTVVDINGRKVRGRLYPWGIVEGQHYSDVSGHFDRVGDDTLNTPPVCLLKIHKNRHCVLTDVLKLNWMLAFV